MNSLTHNFATKWTIVRSTALVTSTRHAGMPVSCNGVSYEGEYSS